MASKNKIGRPVALDDPASLENSIPFLLHRISDVFARKMLSDLRPHGFNVGRWRVLSSVRSLGGEVAIGDLAAFIGIRQPVVSRIVSEMEADGLLKRKPHKDDQRIIFVRLTAAGEKKFDEILPLIQARRDDAVAGIAAADRKKLIATLRAIESNLGIS